MAFPGVALAAVVILMFCGMPVVRLSVDGLAATPEGNPLRATLTVPVKPVPGVALMVRLCEVPATIERLTGESVKVKSG